MTYDLAFYAEETRVAAASAFVVMPEVLRLTNATSVIDIGCGTAAWAAEAARHGCEVKGVDWGVPESLRLIRAYVDHDLTGGYDCTGWDLAICLEVAEHLPASAAEPLVAGLAGATTILFSAATPGQPGVGHINCRSHDYWHTLFSTYGLAPTHVGAWFDEPVADFYRRNLHLYERAT